MPYSPMKVPGAWLFVPEIKTDFRGVFHEGFKKSQLLSETGYDFSVVQVNQSVSSRGVIRGIHWMDVPPGQAKHVSCLRGAIWDIVIDIRTGSPTFGQWDAAVISAENMNQVFLEPGLGHAFLALENDSVANYLCDQPFTPEIERVLNPLDPDLGIAFHELLGKKDFVLSKKDETAPNLKQLMLEDLLPQFSTPK
jgi:dTDP-4-dehydrorhamnose 3,5-epimerase